jgi:hypothetical protein
MKERERKKGWGGLPRLNSSMVQPSPLAPQLPFWAKIRPTHWEKLLLQHPNCLQGRVKGLTVESIVASPHPPGAIAAGCGPLYGAEPSHPNHDTIISCSFPECRYVGQLTRRVSTSGISNDRLDSVATLVMERHLFNAKILHQYFNSKREGYVGGRIDIRDVHYASPEAQARRRQRRQEQQRCRRKQRTSSLGP